MSGTEADLKALRAELAQLREDMVKISGTIGDLARHSGAEALDNFKDATKDLRDHVTGHAESLTRKVEEKPLTAAATSLAIGVVLGMLFGGRRA